MSISTSRVHRTLPTLSPRQMLQGSAEKFSEIDQADLTKLLSRIDDSQIVFLGSSTCGTSEFYSMRARITQELILRKGFSKICLLADHSVGEMMNEFISGKARLDWARLPQFPTWIWKNLEFESFLKNVAQINQGQISLIGLDLYCLYSSIEVILDYFSRKNPMMATMARRCLEKTESWERGHGLSPLPIDNSTRELADSLVERLQTALHDRIHSLKLRKSSIKNSERFYRALCYSSRNWWNLRNEHMIEMLQELILGPDPKARVVVWDHNLNVGNSNATELNGEGRKSFAKMCSEVIGNTYSIGFGSDHGFFRAAPHWFGEPEIQKLERSRSDSYEAVFHGVNFSRFILPLSNLPPKLEEWLAVPRMEKIAGAVFSHDDHTTSHNIEADISEQFDEYVWFDRSTAINPIPG